MSEIESFIQWVISLVSENLYPGVFLAALLETIFPPIPSEAVFPLAGYVILNQNMSIFHIFGVGITGGTGATLGAFVIYLIAKKVGRFAIVKYAKKVRINEKQIIRAESWFSKYGDKAVLFGRMVPGIRELVSIPAGILNMKYVKFFTYTFIGSCVWSIGLTAAGYYFGVATIELF
ncbi:MAG TPA: DedA family protein [Nitrosopumilaceae archaeon]|nr:DedA family protein [Nitrosopumilaceae archaeon]